MDSETLRERQNDAEWESSVLTNRNPKKVQFFDDRIPVARPDVYPSRTVGQILQKARNCPGIGGSGSLNSDYTC